MSTFEVRFAEKNVERQIKKFEKPVYKIFVNKSKIGRIFFKNTNTFPKISKKFKFWYIF